MFRNRGVTVKTRSEVGTRNNVKFIEPDYHRISWKSATYLKMIILFRVFTGILLLFLTVRILFMDGGYLDLASKQSEISKLNTKYTSLTRENMSLKKEVDKIKKSAAYQKVLAREHLGVIAKDELMILFRSKPSETERPKAIDPQS